MRRVLIGENFRDNLGILICCKIMGLRLSRGEENL